jgi:hypothetical protein
VLRIAALVVLIVANGVLLYLLLRPDGALIARPADPRSSGVSKPTAIPPTGTPSTSASSDQTTSSGPGGSKNPTVTKGPIEPAPAERLIFATSSKTAWRATVGDCYTPGIVERSTDGGASWKQMIQNGPAPLVRLGAETGGNLFTIGGTRPSCSARYAAYATDGTVTAAAGSPVHVWFPTPKDRDEINGPHDTKTTPCTDHVVGLATLDLSRAVVICDDGAAMSTRDSGEKWRQVARVPDTLAVTAARGQYWIAGTADDCDGISVRELTVKGNKSSVGVDRCAPADDVGAGQVALDVSEGAIWVWAGSRVAVSKDTGRTWE